MGPSAERVPLSKKNARLDLRECSTGELASFLSHFYTEVRRQDGKPYQRNSLLGCRAAIQRHLSAIGRKVDIFKDQEFSRSNAALDGDLKKLKREGELKPQQHKSIIGKADMETLALYFASEDAKNNPARLLEQCWFIITYHFSLRARETQAEIHKSDIELKINEKGEEFFALTTDFRTKNHQGGICDGEALVSMGRIQKADQVATIKKTAGASPSRLRSPFPETKTGLTTARSCMVWQRARRKEHTCIHDAENLCERGIERAVHQPLGSGNGNHGSFCGWCPGQTHHVRLRAQKSAELGKLLRTVVIAAICHVRTSRRSPHITSCWSVPASSSLFDHLASVRWWAWCLPGKRNRRADRKSGREGSAGTTEGSSSDLVCRSQLQGLPDYIQCIK